MAPRISLGLIGFSSLKRSAESEEAISFPGFYQQLASGLVRSVRNKQVLSALGDRLVLLAEHAHAFRQFDALEETSRILVNLPLRQHENIGHYYRGLRIMKLGRGDLEQAARIIESAAESTPPRYRARALISLGGNSLCRGDFRFALSLYSEAARVGSRDGRVDLFATIHTQKMAAVINGFEGNHRGAVELLESLLPLAQSVRSSQPHLYCDYLNSLAVELCEVGRLEEARNVSKVVLASPFAPTYPEWRETREAIELKARRSSRSTSPVGTPKVACWGSVVSRQQAVGRRQRAEGREQKAEARGHSSANVVALSAARLDASAITPRQEPASTTQRPRTRARVIKFPSSTSWTQEELSEKQMIVADMLWDMFQATIHDAPVNLGLIERLYKVFLDERKPA
jgi:hypothetical protein